ncbi:MAG: dockerin type I domain-containing protein [bacterium]
MMLPTQPTHAVGTLDYPKDLISSNIVNRVGVSHTVDFTLPISSQQITPSDWIIITFINYTNVTPASSVTGGFGTPTFQVEGNRAKITNLALLPGTSIEISGMTAQNPLDGADTSVIISVSDSSSGLTIRNQSTVIPTQGGGYVQVSATFKSPLSAVSFTGFTSPGTFVNLTENGTVIGTAAADIAGSFLFSITGLSPGTHTFAIAGSDTANRTTAQATLQLDLVGGTVTTVNGILLSPTLELDKSQIQPGDTLKVSGAAKPNSQINIFTESPLRSYSTSSNGQGDWSYTLSSVETATYQAGEYRLYASAQDSGGNQSIASNTLSFTVVTNQTSDNPPPACDISHGDLNCDGRTNLVDFSILLFHWQTNHRVADINSDTRVNLVDFSIMMFYFTR